MAPLIIAVIGGGISGLVAAAGLAKNGHQVTVYERSKVRGGVGFAFRIGPHADRCLASLGVDALAGGGSQSAGLIFRDINGKQLGQLDEHTTEGPRSVFAYRPQLLEQLWEVAEKEGAVIEEGTKVDSVDAASSSVRLNDGRTIHADLIIGADGVHSVVRPAVVDAEKHKPVATLGRNAFRFMIPTETLQNDPLTRELYSGAPYNNAWLGDRISLISYPVDFGRQMNMVCLHPQELSDNETATSNTGIAIDYSQKVSATTVLSIYEAFDPRARRHLELADPHGFRAWKLLDMDALPRWSFHHTVLLGDSCHPVLPFGFNGAAMGIEDATVLASLLPRGTGKDDLRKRLEVWEEMRRPRVDRVRDYSRYANNTPEEAEAYLAFLTPYDAVRDAEERLKSLQSQV
ncbi:FAD/NAD(P)-binding domain-containing protein [Myriangium duriaei CBS 260.36]|uniref:FAD/NAD(P)-binding domain-containing protein n=1 Tax=Myriangium duriaei CBS 260.36 TaxID=1168546 RepID=A0A9P4J335_9PEZI|nr:FAD/NAD(P)-binding domain-containing protein [Myriangium duriaei CBS 260.36]